MPRDVEIILGPAHGQRHGHGMALAVLPDHSAEDIRRTEAGGELCFDSREFFVIDGSLFLLSPDRPPSLHGTDGQAEGLKFAPFSIQKLVTPTDE